jgi:Trk K+ transport system NAD-binding subunit
MLVVRPISIAVCTWNSDLNWRQKAFLAWIAPKGIVSASVASLFAILLTEKGINGGDAIKALVFLTILMTVFFQGLTARWVANWLNITSSDAKGAVIIGCDGLGRFMGRLFQQLGESVVMIDTDPDACKKAEADNLPVFQSSALDTEVLAEAGIESMGTFLALTNNGEVNLVLAQRAAEEFKPPRVLAAFPQNNSTEGNSASKVSQALISQLPIKIWNSYIDDGQIKLGRTIIQESDFSFKSAHLQALIRAGEMLPLILKRGDSFQVAVADEEWQAGDEIYYLLHDPRPKLLKRLSGGNQSSRLLLERLPEVEEISLATSIPQISSEKVEEAI